MKKIGILLLIIINMVLLSGCWDRVEINDIAIVTAVGIDKTEAGDISLSLLVFVPKMLSSTGTAGGGGEGKSATMLLSESGKGIIDAFSRLQGRSSRSIMFSHIRMIVIGERLARDGVAEVLDFFARFRQPNLRAYLLFTKEDINEVLMGDPGIENVVSELVREQVEVGKGVKIDLKDFFYMLTEEGINPIAGELVNIPLTGKGKSNEESQQLKPKQTSCIVKGAAAFRKDKLIDWLSEEEIRGVLWLRNEVKPGSGTITIDIPAEKGGGKIGVRLRAVKTNVEPKINGDVLTMDVSTNTQVVIFESSSRMDLSDPKSVYYVETAVEKRIKEKLQRTLNKVQKEVRADVLGFGTTVYRNYPKEWREKYKDNWDEAFAELNVQISCKVWISRVGFVTNSLTLKEDEIKK